MSRGKACLAGGLVAGALVAGAWRLYNQRTRVRVPSQEGLDDPEVTRAFARIAEMPQMRALRWYVAQRATRLASVGDALDLGCGPGHLALQLAKAAPELRVT
jgi:2-polyprenyl-3-methyl-5-hydroxy-6-metoxy-1,4-benzoquinol methylase